MYNEVVNGEKIRHLPQAGPNISYQKGDIVVTLERSNRQFPSGILMKVIDVMGPFTEYIDPYDHRVTAGAVKIEQIVTFGGQKKSGVCSTSFIFPISINVVCDATYNSGQEQNDNLEAPSSQLVVA